MKTMAAGESGQSKPAAAAWQFMTRLMAVENLIEILMDYAR
jgi:hypothetical protein